MDACTHGDIRIAGVRSETLLAGRVDLCYQEEWRVVCQNLWDRNDAMVVCRQFGFPAEGLVPSTFNTDEAIVCFLQHT